MILHNECTSDEGIDGCLFHFVAHLPDIPPPWENANITSIEYVHFSTTQTFKLSGENHAELLPRPNSYQLIWAFENT